MLSSKKLPFTFIKSINFDKFWSLHNVLSFPITNYLLFARSYLWNLSSIKPEKNENKFFSFNYNIKLMNYSNIKSKWLYLPICLFKKNWIITIYECRWNIIWFFKIFPQWARFYHGILNYTLSFIWQQRSEVLYKSVVKDLLADDPRRLEPQLNV